MFLDHTQRRTTFGGTPLDEWSARRRDLYLTTHELITRPEESYRLWCVVVCNLETSRIGAPYIYMCVCVCIYIYIYDISNLRVNWSEYICNSPTFRDTSRWFYLVTGN